MESQYSEPVDDPQIEPVGVTTRSRRGRDRSRYDYRDTPIDSPLWLKTLPKRQRRNIHISEPAEKVTSIGEGKKFVKEYVVVGKGKGKIGLDEMEEEINIVQMMEDKSDEEADKDVEMFAKYDKMRKQAIAVRRYMQISLQFVRYNGLSNCLFCLYA